MSEATKFNPAKLLLIIVPLIFIIAIIVYLSSSDDCYTNANGTVVCLSGWETLKLQWPGFWWAIAGFSIVGVILALLGYFNATGNGKIGRMLPGGEGLTYVFIIVAIGFIAGPWGKACTDKRNGGITAPGHQLTDSTNIKTTAVIIHTKE
ncbi:MAG TPA: hypothetical protein VMZ03_03935 [Chitinophagaceae bacterium]|nr:hypothetical protein [Chitinophagaceae bacterium]